MFTDPSKILKIHDQGHLNMKKKDDDLDFEQLMFRFQKFGMDFMKFRDESRMMESPVDSGKVEGLMQELRLAKIELNHLKQQQHNYDELKRQIDIDQKLIIDYERRLGDSLIKITDLNESIEQQHQREVELNKQIICDIQEKSKLQEKVTDLSNLELSLRFDLQQKTEIIGTLLKKVENQRRHLASLQRKLNEYQ
jgi:hypothetical protein